MALVAFLELLYTVEFRKIWPGIHDDNDDLNDYISSSDDEFDTIFLLIKIKIGETLRFQIITIVIKYHNHYRE